MVENAIFLQQITRSSLVTFLSPFNKATKLCQTLFAPLESPRLLWSGESRNSFSLNSTNLKRAYVIHTNLLMYMDSSYTSTCLQDVSKIGAPISGVYIAPFPFVNRIIFVKIVFSRITIDLVCFFKVLKNIWQSVIIAIKYCF